MSIRASLMAQQIKNLPAMWEAQEIGLIPGSGRSPGVGNSNPLQYYCLKNPMDRGAWWAIVQKVTTSWTQLSMYCNYHHRGFSLVS